MDPGVWLVMGGQAVAKGVEVSVLGGKLGENSIQELVFPPLQNSVQSVYANGSRWWGLP